MVQTMICDSDSNYAKNLSEEIYKEFGKYDIEVQNSIFLDGIELMNAYTPDVPLYFLDVQLPGMSGFDAAQQIQQKNPAAQFIFVSSHEEAVFEAFRYQPLRFIRKSRISEELPEAIREFVRLFQTKEAAILIPATIGQMWIRVSELIYIESNAHYLNLHCQNGDYRVRGKLAEYIEKLKGFYFIQPSKSYLVNCFHISEITSYSILLQNRNIINISHSHKTHIKEAYAAFSFFCDQIK